MEDQKLIEMIRKKVKARGCRGIAGIGRRFRIHDDSGNGRLDQ